MDVVHRVLQDSGLPSEQARNWGSRKSFIMGESQGRSRILQALRDLGVTLAVDDFGTGYSSLAYLKITTHSFAEDRQVDFIRDIPEDTNDMAITRAVIALAKPQPGLVGEGVETEINDASCSKEGCPFGQGFLFHRPLPARRDLQALLFAQQSVPAPALRLLIGGAMCGGSAFALPAFVVVDCSFLSSDRRSSSTMRPTALSMAFDLV